MRQPSQRCRFFPFRLFILFSCLPLSPPACRLWRSVNERADGSGGNCCKAEAVPGRAGLERLGSRVTTGGFAPIHVTQMPRRPLWKRTYQRRSADDGDGVRVSFVIVVELVAVIAVDVFADSQSIGVLALRWLVPLRLKEQCQLLR